MESRPKTLSSRKISLACLFLFLTATYLFSQSAPSPKNQNSSQSGDLFTVAQADHSLSMFVAAAQFSGMAKALREQAPLTVYAPSNQAFANLPKDDLEALLASPAAMNILLTHYIARGSIRSGDTPSLLSARTFSGEKLRADLRSETSYVNGAKLTQVDILCANGTLHTVGSLDPGLVHDAVAVAKANRRAK